MAYLKSTRILLPLAARPGTTVAAPSTATATNPGYREDFMSGIRLYLNVTVGAGGPSNNLTLNLRGHDPISGTPYTLLASDVLELPGLYVFELGPAIAEASLATNYQSGVLPVEWSVQIVQAGTVTFTYSLACELFQ